LRQSFFNLRRQQSAATHQFGKKERSAICKSIEQSSAGTGELHLRIRLRQHQPMPEVLALIKRDRTGSQGSARTRVWILRRAQTSPANPAGKTKAIEPFRIVVGNTRRQDRGFPRGQRQLEAVELFEDRLQPFQTFDVMLRIGTLPCKQKSIKILR
jgi:hypothetical protein